MSLADDVYSRMKKKGGAKADPPEDDADASAEGDEGGADDEGAKEEGADGLALCDALESREGAAVEELIRRICNYNG